MSQNEQKIMDHEISTDDDEMVGKFSQERAISGELA